MTRKCLALLTALCLCLSLGCASAEQKTYKVGILQLIQHPALDAATQGFKDALTEKLGNRVTFDENNASGEVGACGQIATTLVASQCDLLLGNATAALQALANATADIPILGTSITDYASALEIQDWTGATGFNVSGTSDLAPLDKQAECIKELFPEAQTVGLLYCSAEANSVYQVVTITEYLEALGFTCKPFGFSDSNDLASVTELALENDVIYIPTDNTCAAYTETIANIVLPAKVPVFAGEEGICKGCGIATLSISYYDLGYQTGLMAWEILENGADVSAMEVRFAPEVTKEYNAANAAELGIAIPEGYAALAE